MHNVNKVIGTAVVFTALSASIAAAQTAFTGTDIAEERNEALIEAIEEDAEREAATFGNEGRPQGFSGSVALRGTASSGNSETVSLGAGANLGFVDGPNGYELQMNYAYAEDSGTVTEKALFYGLEYTREMNNNLFGFAKLQGNIDDFSAFSTDTFIGVGAGYRIINTPTRQWSVQAGPGYRFAEFSGLATDINEAALAVSSDFYTRVTDTIGLTNDTDIISSESDTNVVNDFSVSVSVNDSLAVRSSLLTTYHSDPLPGFENTDNAFGVSLVYDLK